MKAAFTQTTRERGRVEQVPSVIHSYPFDPCYRLSGDAVPQPGDIARCGFRKVTPYHPDQTRSVTCVVCRDLMR